MSRRRSRRVTPMPSSDPFFATTGRGIAVSRPIRRARAPGDSRPTPRRTPPLATLRYRPSRVSRCTARTTAMEEHEPRAGPRRNAARRPHPLGFAPPGRFARFSPRETWGATPGGDLPPPRADQLRQVGRGASGPRHRIDQSLRNERHRGIWSRAIARIIPSGAPKGPDVQLAGDHHRRPRVRGRRRRGPSPRGADRARELAERRQRGGCRVRDGFALWVLGAPRMDPAERC